MSHQKKTEPGGNGLTEIVRKKKCYMKNMGSMMKQMMEMRSKAKAIEKELSSLEVSGISKNKLVTCIVDGKFTIKSLDISNELIEKKDKELIEKSIKEALSSAINDAQKEAAAKLSGAGLNLPGLM